MADVNKIQLSKIEWTCIILVELFVGYCFFHGDVAVTTYHSMNLWECIWEGNSIFDFYSYNYQGGQVYCISDLWYQIAAIYDFPVYLIFAIWNLPMWIISKIFAIDVLKTVWGVMYAKTVVYIFAFASAYVLYLISKEISNDEQTSKNIGMIFLSSGLCFTICFVIAQYDIFGIFFSLLGILAYIKNKKVKFLICFSIAICFKYFALLAFVPLVLIKEKNILKILGQMLVGTSLTISLMVVFKAFGTLSGREGAALKFLQDALSHNLPGVFSGLNIFVFSYVMVCIICYFKQEINVQAQLWILLIVYSCFFINAKTNVYWLILILPYICLLMNYNTEQMASNIILETIVSISAILSMGVHYTGQFSMFHMIRTFIGKIFGTIDASLYYSDPYMILIKSEDVLSISRSVMNACFASALLMFIIFSNPIKKMVAIDVNERYRTIIYCRMLVCTLLLIMPVGVYISLL